ncbi:MAG: metal-sensitive transcriptional regulator [Candidatus Bipolaricaulia bacterium]
MPELDATVQTHPDSTPDKGSLAEAPQTKHEAHRLARTVSGHIHGIETMITEERYCIDILKQIAAVRGMLSRLADEVSESHMKHCVREAIDEGHGDERIEELMETLKYLRSV